MDTQIIQEHTWLLVGVRKCPNQCGKLSPCLRLDILDTQDRIQDDNVAAAAAASMPLTQLLSRCRQSPPAWANGIMPTRIDPDSLNLYFQVCMCDAAHCLLSCLTIHCLYKALGALHHLLRLCAILQETVAACKLLLGSSCPGSQADQDSQQRLADIVGCARQVGRRPSCKPGQPDQMMRQSMQRIWLQL